MRCKSLKLSTTRRNSYLIYLVVMSRYSVVISKILISAYFNIFGIIVEYLDIFTEYIR